VRRRRRRKWCELLLVLPLPLLLAVLVLLLLLLGVASQTKIPDPFLSGSWGLLVYLNLFLGEMRACSWSHEQR